MKKTLAALLALCLLIGLCPAAVTEDFQDEVLSEAVECTVPEEEVALGGGEAEVGEAAVSASNDDSYSMVHITRPTGYTKVQPGAEVEVWLRFDSRTDWDAGTMAANLTPVTVQLWKNDTLIDTRTIRPGVLDFSDEGAKYLTLTLDGIGVYEIRASVPYSRTEYSEARVYVASESEPTPKPELANPVGEGEKTVRITSPKDGAELSAGRIPIVVQLVRPASGDPGREAVEALYAPLDIMIYREGRYEDLESRFGDELPDESFKPWSAYEFNAELAGAYEIRVCSREFEIWDSVTVQVNGPTYYDTKPESKNLGYHVLPKRAEYTVDLKGSEKTVRVEWTLNSYVSDDDFGIWSDYHLDINGADCVEFADMETSGEYLEYDHDSNTWYMDYWAEYTARKTGTAKLHVYACTSDAGKVERYDHREILIHVIDSSATPEPTASPKPTAAPKTSIAKAKVTLKSTSYTYNGKSRKPAPTVKLGGKTLKKGTDYAVSYKNNKAVGTATVTVKGKGAYTGTVKKTFVINPKAVTGLKLTAGAKKLTVTWKKVGGAGGYEIQYGTKSSFSGAKTLTVKNGTATKAALKSLKAGKKYHVRIRAYRKVNKKTYYSAWVKASQKTK